jgi:hypothetical protein
MVEFLGVVLAGCTAGLAWLAWLLLRALRRLLPGLLPGPRPLRSAPIRLARHRLRHADQRAAELTAEIERLRLALRAARSATTPATTSGRDRFQEAKRAFALRFHPDRITARAAERLVRIAMFKEHWAELRRIERE